MPAKMMKPAVTALYAEDFVAWAGRTAQLLRERRFEELDVENLVEEVEAMASRDKRELLSRTRVLLLHLVKRQAQPHRRSRSWRSTIHGQRTEIGDLLGQSPSLRAEFHKGFRRAYRQAVKAAAIETGLPLEAFPAECGYSAEQILDDNYLPE